MIRIRTIFALCTLSLMGCALQPGETASASAAALGVDHAPESDDAPPPSAPASNAQTPDPEGDEPSQPHPSPWMPPGEAEGEPHPSPWNPNETQIAPAARSGR